MLYNAALRQQLNEGSLRQGERTMIASHKRRRAGGIPATLLACLFLFGGVPPVRADDPPPDADQQGADDGAVEVQDIQPAMPIQRNMNFANDPDIIHVQGPNGPMIYRRNPLTGN